MLLAFGWLGAGGANNGGNVGCFFNAEAQRSAEDAKRQET
jgi:hypothetical protein